MSVAGEFERRIGADELCAETARAVRENDRDALRRLGMRGFAEYAGRLSELMTGSVLDGLDYSDDFGELMRQVNSPARYAHHLVNECGTAVQTALDERQGLRLRVVQPDYNDGRTKGLIGEALSRETPEQGTGLLAAGLGTGVKDAGNEFMKQNAEQRSRAGFAVTVERSGGSNCCPWCSARIGKWELKSAPDGVFGCHDNCTCMVAYTNSRGVRSQRLGRARFVEVNYAPTRLTDGEKRGAGEPKRLTGGANGGIMSSRYYEDINAFTGADKIEKVTKELLQQAISVIPEQLQKELSEYVSRLYIGDNNCRSAFSPDTREIRLNPQTGNQSIIHELGHAFGEMIGAYNDPEFIEILSEGLYLNDWGEVIYDGGDKAHDNRIAYAIESPKFIRSYQGRIYPPNEDEIITDSPISPEWLKEYISVGFDAYFRTPDLLKEKDPKLYSYLEKKINDRITRRV